MVVPLQLQKTGQGRGLEERGWGLRGPCSGAAQTGTRSLGLGGEPRAACQGTSGVNRCFANGNECAHAHISDLGVDQAPSEPFL
jgi:hypothetical protein